MNGFKLLKNAIDEETENTLIENILLGTWSNELSRRTQQYGYKYDYYSRQIERVDTPIPEYMLIPPILEHIAPEQVIVNEYTNGQGIASHTDARVFGPKILILSLNSDTKMTFSTNDDSIDITLPRRSLLILSDDMRYKVKHAIKKHTGNTRYSITYRTIS
jgi:alkylated DNA repair dioxygenase AlkB